MKPTSNSHSRTAKRMRKEHRQRELERAGATAWKASRIALDVDAPGRASCTWPERRSHGAPFWAPPERCSGPEVPQGRKPTLSPPNAQRATNK